jgi:lipopolysaccharide biosynthesis protein
MSEQVKLANRYGVNGFCFYYYWFNGERLLELPIEQMLKSKEPNFPFCLCWANENWTRRWDGQEHEVLMSQSYSDESDKLVIEDLARFFVDERYIRINGKPLILVYRVTSFPDFLSTSKLWRKLCREMGVGEIYIAMVESFDLVGRDIPPSTFGCDASVEFPPHGMGEQKDPSGPVVNDNFDGVVADYGAMAIRFSSRAQSGYTRFPGVSPGWDNTARRQDNGYCFENSSPEKFQAWLESAIECTRIQNYGDERIVFVNAWNEWAEGAYLEPDRRFGHAYLEAVKNALDAHYLKKKVCTDD